MPEESSIINFYLDENLPPRVAHALDALEGEHGHNVYHTADIFSKEIQDVDLIPMIHKNNGILLTRDMKMRFRKEEYTLIESLGVTVIFISLVNGTTFHAESRAIIENWEDIVNVCERHKKSFMYQVRMRGKNSFY